MAFGLGIEKRLHQQKTQEHKSSDVIQLEFLEIFANVCYQNIENIFTYIIR